MLVLPLLSFLPRVSERLFTMSVEVNKETLNKNLVSIMDIDFINVSKSNLLQIYLYPTLDNKEKAFIVTANPEIVMNTKEDATYKGMVQQADYIVPDGAGIVLASKYLKNPVKERIPGYDLMLDLLHYANEKRLSCYFLGAQENVVSKTVETIKETYPNITIAGYHHGYFPDEDIDVAEAVGDVHPDLIFVALGSPRQEKWITQNMDSFSKGLFMGVGGSFDVLAGEVKRAPDKWINMNLEWLYRLLKQPLRWKRILKAIKFMFLVIIKRK